MTTTVSDEITLSGEQAAIFKIMEETKQHLFITGRAGAGKSVLFRRFKEKTKKHAVSAAPTGIAALNIKGATLHSLFHLPFGLFQKEKGLEPDDKLRSVLTNIDTLMIDEISMVRADVLDAVSARLKEARNSEEPFGGVQVLMFGDVYQLPPVVGKNLAETGYFETYYQGPFFFNAHVWQETSFKVFQLEQVFRQKDPDFKNALNAVREGSHTDEHLKKLNARCGVATPKEGTITLASTNKQVSQINQERLRRLPGQMKEYHARITGSIKENSFPTEETLQLKKDAQVVFLRNDPEKRYINGTVGIIEDMQDDSIDVKIGDKTHKIDRYTWEEITYVCDPDTKDIEEKVTSSFTQFPVRLAWALTMHKSQGQTYESVAIDLTMPTFAHGQMYVALSRATSLEGLCLNKPIVKKHIIVDPIIKQFMSRVEAVIIETPEEAAAEIAEAVSAGDQGAAAIDVIAEAEAIAATSSAPEADDQGGQPEATSSAKRPYGGRKAYVDSDKKIPVQTMWDQAIKAAFNDYRDMLNEQAEKEISEGKLLEMLVMSNPSFAAFFESSQYASAYADRMARQAEARQAYQPKGRKNKKKADQPEASAPAGE